MKRPTLRILGVALAGLLCAGGGASAGVPDFALPTPEGHRVSLKDLLGKGPVLIDFWATTCRPCLKAMPKLEEIHRKYRDRGLTVLGVNEDGPRSQAKLRPFLSARGISFPVVIDADGGLMRRMLVGSLPTTFLIAPDGRTVFRQVGYTPDIGPLIAAIESLLPSSGADKRPSADARGEE